jgi:two-component sensor histidine kinase
MHLSDDGAGLPASFDPQASAGLGMRIMQALLRQLDGRLTLGAADPGTTVLVEVPLHDAPAGLH